MSPVNLKNLGFQKNQPKDREGLSRARTPGRGHLGPSSGWKDTEGNHTHPAIPVPIQQEPQPGGLEIYGSSSSAPPTPQRFISMQHGKQEVQPGISLGRNWSKFPEDLSQRDRLQRPYGNYQRLESHLAVQTPGGEGKQDKGESSHYPSYRRTADPDGSILRFLQAHKEQAKSALQWLHTIHKQTYQCPRVTILHNPRKFPGEDKDKRAKTRPPSARGRRSQTQ
ncbi:hypothetical protein O181_112926 [Austropuccinia psidii MF-1]|uniref:Uncharacterized protein n=1 Tax=Austropuccinia psidii MF-1 TaxID=1389203 RepID=A0A9Q3K3B1_9BASI|nr:hypothetical protein [Austropuccinia psidii MF-1]